MGTILTAESRQDLLVRHKRERDRRVADRIKAVLLRDDGWSYGQIAEALFLTDEGVRQQIEDFLKQNGKLAPENGGSVAWLSDGDAQKLEAHLNEKIYTRTCDIADCKRRCESVPEKRRNRLAAAAQKCTARTGLLY